MASLVPSSFVVIGGMLCKLVFFWLMYLVLMRTTVLPLSLQTLALLPRFDKAFPLVHIQRLPARKKTVSFSVAHLSMPSENDGLFK